MNRVSLLFPLLLLAAAAVFLPTFPALVMILGALLLPWVREQDRPSLILGLPLLTLALIWRLPDGVLFNLSFLDYSLEPVKVTPVGRLFATVFAIAAFTGGLFALRQARLVELVAAYVYAGGAIGVTLTGDLLTLFVFWELMALGSTLGHLGGGYRGRLRRQPALSADPPARRRDPDEWHYRSCTGHWLGHFPGHAARQSGETG